jgi:hypothetical protein
MTLANHRGPRPVADRAPARGVPARRLGPALALGLLLVVALGVSDALAAGWTQAQRVTDRPGSRMDSLHQLAGAGGVLHLVHARVGSGTAVHRVAYQRSGNGGRRWSAERNLFRAGSRHRRVVPNLALAARGSLVVVAWRTLGPTGSTLFVRVSRDSGRTFAPRVRIAQKGRRAALGVPAVAIGQGFISVAWTDRTRGDVRVRTSRDGGRGFGQARTLARTTLSIECRSTRLDGLVGLAAAGTRLHLAWSTAGSSGGCIASRVRTRTSDDRGRAWGAARDVTRRPSYGWPELAARGRTVLATLQLVSGRLLVARSGDRGRTWREHLVARPSGRSLGTGDVGLTPDGNAWLAYVDERYSGGRLASTRVRVRRSQDGGRTWGRAVAVAPDRTRLRQAPNLAAAGRDPVVVFQAGPLDGSRTNLLVTRRTR